MAMMDRLGHDDSPIVLFFQAPLGTKLGHESVDLTIQRWVRPEIFTGITMAYLVGVFVLSQVRGAGEWTDA